MSTIADIPVPYTLPRKPEPTLEGSPEGRSGRLAFHVLLDDLAAFLAAVGGTSETIDIGGGSTVERVVPLSHPFDPSLFAVAYNTRFFGTPGGSSAYAYATQFSHAEVVVDFATIPFGTGGDTPYYTFVEEHGASVETIPDGGLTFTDGSHTTGDYGLTIPVISYSLTTYMSLAPISYAIASLVGTVNSAPFIIPGVGTYPVGTIWFKGSRSEYAVGMFSRTRVKNFSLQYRPRPWVQVLRKDGVWDVPTLGATGLLKYSSSDLNVLKYS